MFTMSCTCQYFQIKKYIICFVLTYTVAVCLVLYCYCFMCVMVCQETTDAKYLKLQAGAVHQMVTFMF